MLIQVRASLYTDDRMKIALLKLFVLIISRIVFSHKHFSYFLAKSHFWIRILYSLR